MAPDVTSTIDDAIMTEILSRNLYLVMHALDDAAAWREQLEDEGSAEAYQALAAELEEFQAPE
jgi:hypothetical protein